MKKNPSALTATKKPCAECPFVRTSTRGYLGPWESPKDLIMAAHSDFGGGFACHMTVKESGSWEDAKVCSGSLLSANKSCKVYRDLELQTLQDEADPVHLEDVMASWEFIEYHDSGIFQ